MLKGKQSHVYVFGWMHSNEERQHVSLNVASICKIQMQETGRNWSWKLLNLGLFQLGILFDTQENLDELKLSLVMHFQEKHLS